MNSLKILTTCRDRIIVNGISGFVKDNDYKNEKEIIAPVS